MSVGLLSKGITLSYKKEAAFVELLDLQEIPDLGGSVDNVEVTTLADGTKRYIRGIKDYGDLEFTFLYDNTTATSSYRVLKGLEDAGTVTEFQVEIPDGTTFAFSGQVMTSISGVGVGDAMTFTANITLNTEMTITNPA